MEKLKIFVNRYKDRFTQTINTPEFKQRLERGTVVLSNTRPPDMSLIPGPETWLGRVNEIVSDGDDMYIVFTPYEERYDLVKHLSVSGFGALPLMIGDDTYLNIICFIFASEQNHRGFENYGCIK